MIPPIAKAVEEGGEIAIGRGLIGEISRGINAIFTLIVVTLVIIARASVVIMIDFDVIEMTSVIVAETFRGIPAIFIFMIVTLAIIAKASVMVRKDSDVIEMTSVIVAETSKTIVAILTFIAAIFSNVPSGEDN